MKNSQENLQDNAEHSVEKHTNFLGEIPESWQRCARAAFGYIFCVYMFIAVSSEITVAILPETTWLIKIITVMNNIESHLYHFGIGLGIAIIAPCLAWEHLMYLREKRKREQEQRAREQEQRAREQEQRAREQAEAIVAELQKEVDHLRSELAALKTRSHPPRGENRD
jgi:hypothetical protein